MQCPACGVEVVEQAVYCHKCGERITPASDNFVADGAPPPNGPAAALQPPPGMRQPGQLPPEEDLWRGGYSPKAMLAGWVISGAVSLLLLAGGILWCRTASHWLILVVAMLLPWAYHLIVLAYRRMSVRYVLTSQRFIHERGLLRRINDRIELLDMNDITFEQGLLERMVGVGTIRILSNDRSHPDLVLPGIDNVKAVAALFDNTRLAERRRRGLLHIEQA
jgi:hypothetical protein